jgi:hypothetical protein
MYAAQIPPLPIAPFEGLFTAWRVNTIRIGWPRRCRTPLKLPRLMRRPFAKALAWGLSLAL